MEPKLMIGTLLGAVVTGVLIKLLGDECKAWLPWITERLIRRAVKMLPESERQRYAEEWRSHLNEVPGEIGKLIHGLDFLRAGWNMSGTQNKYEGFNLFRALRRRVYLIGDGSLALRVKEALESRPELGLDLVGWARTAKAGEIEELLKAIGSAGKIQQVIIAISDRRLQLPVKELLELRLKGAVVVDGSLILEKLSGQIEVDELRPSWLIFGEGIRVRSKHWIARRVISTVSALVLTVLTLALVPFIAILIKLSSRGPVLSRQNQVGLNGRSFQYYKFRTMRSDAAEMLAPTWACDDDPRITKVGRFLRISRLDEIPQLWSVLSGDMQFVGPRPERPEFVEMLSKAIPYYNLRHATRPGITGWAQLRSKYSNTIEDAKEKLRYDLYYIKNCSLALDLWILFNTIRSAFFSRRKKGIR